MRTLFLILFATLSTEAYASGGGSLGLGTTSYWRSGSEESLPGIVQPTVELRGFAEHRGPVVEARASGEVRGQMSSRENSFYLIEAPEAFVAARAGAFRFSIGRQLGEWSRLDDAWELGLYQPRFRWDVIHPESVGLTGAFIEVEQPLFRLTAFASPLFVPERGSQMEMADGSVRAHSPFITPPPSTMPIFEQATRVRYDVAMPPVSELLAHAGAGIRARVGRQQGAWAAAAYAYKPMNQCMLSYDGLLALGPQEVQVTLFPRVVYHHVTALDAGFEAERFALTLSGLEERPVRDETAASWTNQEVSLARAVSPTATLKFSTGARLDVSYLRQWGGNASDTGRYANPSLSFFDQRYPYQSAWSLSARAPLARGLGLQGRWLQDMGHQGSILSASAAYAFARGWSATAGVDFLVSGLALEGDEAQADFISRHRGDDRLQAGVSYAF